MSPELSVNLRPIAIHFILKRVHVGATKCYTGTQCKSLLKDELGSVEPTFDHCWCHQALVLKVLMQ